MSHRNSASDGRTCRRTGRVLSTLLAASAAAAVAIATPSISCAEDHAQVFAGGSVDFSKSGYVGGALALPGSAMGQGLALRASAFAGDYDYQSNGVTVDGDFKGAEVDLVYQFSGASSWLNAGAGVRYVDTSLSPFDPGNRRHGKQAEPAFSLDGGDIVGPWRVDFYGSFGTRLEDYQVRASLTHKLTGTIRAGGEISAEGDPTYDLQRLGPYVGYQLNSKSEIQLSSGVSRQSGEGTGGFVRLQFVRSF